MEILIKGLLGVCMILCIAFGVQRCSYKNLEKYHAEYKTAIYQEMVEAHKNAREKEHASAKEVFELGLTYESNVEQIKQTHARELAAAIKSGDARLRKQWQTFQASGTGTDGPTASELDAAHELRVQDIGYLRELGAIADERERALQEYSMKCYQFHQQ